MMNRRRSALLLLSCFLVLGVRVSGRGDAWSAGGLPEVLPPVGATTPAATAPIAPTAKQVGNLPSLVYSTVSERFLLVLRRLDGTVVDVARTDVRTVTVLHGDVGELLLLDVRPLDGTGLPVLGVPVTMGVAVTIAVAEG